MNEALTLATETLVLQQKLQTAQSTRDRPEPGAQAASVAPPPVPSRQNESRSWLELLLSALVGGGIASFTAHLLSRRRQQQTLAELTATFTPAGPAPEPFAPPPATTPVPAPPPEVPAVGRAGVDLDVGEPDPGDVSVDEGDSALHLAEIMLSYGRIKGAVDVLAAHIEENSPDRIEPWLTLLNLYRRGNMREDFESLMQRMRSRFNFRIPGWEQSQTPISGLLSLEDYDHVTRNLVANWGTQEAMDYLCDLIHDNRHGQRMGFPLEVVEEILLLMLVLEQAYGCRRHP